MRGDHDLEPAVSAGDVEVVRAIHDAWLEDQSAEELIHRDLEYVNPPDAVEPGVRRGRATFEAVFEMYEDFRVEPEEFIDTGDDVVVIARLSGRGKGSGVELQWRQGYVWTVRDGKAIRFAWFNDPEAAKRAAGL